MAKQKRRRFTSEQKAAILRRHLVDKIPVSDLCDEYKIQPSVFYSWQRQLLENMVVALDGGKDRHASERRDTKLKRENEALKAKLAKKDNVIAEISEQFVTLKKEFGEL
ncbi:MAG: transposase [Cyanobacteria bacterium J06648_11]